MNIFKQGFLIIIAIFTLVLIFIIFIGGIVYSILSISFTFHEYKLDKQGAVFLELLLALASLYIINHVRKNLRKRNWIQINNGVVIYTILRSNTHYSEMATINFTYQYRVSLRNYERKFFVNIKGDKIDKAEQVLNQKINLEQYKPLIYTDPRNGKKNSFQNEFTILNILVLPIFLFTQLFLLMNAVYLDFLGTTGSRAFELSSLVNIYQNSIFIFQNLQASPDYYFMILNFVLILIYLITLVYGIVTQGIKGSRNYPLFYREGNDIPLNLIYELSHMSKLCDQCGEIIENNDIFCANCGKSVLINS